MPYIELFKPLHVQDGRHVLVIEPVTRIDPETGVNGMGGRVKNFPYLAVHRFHAPGVAVAAGMNFDEICARLLREIDNRPVRLDEQRHQHAEAVKHLHNPPDPLHVSAHIKAAFGGELLPLFRHEGDLVRHHPLCDVNHVFGERHFKVELSPDHVPKRDHVAVLYMPPVFAQMHGYAVGTALLADHGAPDGIGLEAAARLPDCRDVVDVHAEQYFSHRLPPHIFSSEAPNGLTRKTDIIVPNRDLSTDFPAVLQMETGPKPRLLT